MKYTVEQYKSMLNDVEYQKKAAKKIAEEIVGGK